MKVKEPDDRERINMRRNQFRAFEVRVHQF